MARTGVLGSSLSPFGGAATDFGAFDVAKTVDAQESANLAFAIEREKHDAGLMTDAQFAAIQANYLNGLDKTTISGATAQYTIQMAQYANDRNALQQMVQSGQADAEQLVAFDQNALAQVVPGSSEYMQRQDRLWTSQGMVFQQAENTVLDNLKDGRITNLQAQDWYKQQAVLFPDNFAIQTDIKGKIAEFADRIVAEADKAMADSWNKGNMTIAQVIGYVAKAAADDPGGSRAKELQQFAHDARLQAQEASMKYRYDLTREYEQLSKLVQQSAPSTGGTSTRTSTRTFWNGSDWVTQTSKTTSANKPTAAMIAANAQRLKDIANAKTRMAQIQKTIGNIAGGWVSDQDYIRNLTAQQVSMAKGSPGWYALQQQIDGYQQRIEQDKMDAALGLRVAYPRVASETRADLSVGSEVPVGTGLTSAQLRQVQGWNAAITRLQESVATGLLTEEQLTQATADIARNKAYIAGALKGTTAPKATVTPISRATSGSSGGTVAASTGRGATTSAGTTKANGGAMITAGPLLRVTDQYVQPNLGAAPGGREGGMLGQAAQGRYIKTTATGLPVGMSPSAFDDFHAAFIDAIKKGQPSFKDKTTGAVYAIPIDPDARLAMMRYVDTANVDLKVANLKAALANPKAADSYIDGKRTALTNAQNYATSNILWVLNTSSAGVVLGPDGKAIGIGTSPNAGKASNALAFGVDLMDTAANHAQQHYDLAQDYFDKGDYTNAAAEINAGRQAIAEVSVGRDGTSKSSLLAQYAASAANTIQAVAEMGGKVDSSILDDLKRLNNFGVELQEPSKDIDKTAALLFGQPGKIGTGILAISNGMVMPDAISGAALMRPGWVRFINPDGSVTPKQVKSTGQEDGKPSYNQKGRVMVMVNVGTSQEPMSAEYEVGQVGEMLVGGRSVPMYGKIVTVGEAVWMESPFRPGLWLPMDGASTTRFVAPTGTKVGQNGAAGGAKIPNLPVGADFLQFNRGGKQYILAPNATGGMDLYENSINGARWVGSGGTETGMPDQNYTKVVSDFGYDISTLSPEQRAISNLVARGINKTGGAWIGSSSQDIADYMIRAFPSSINAATGFDTLDTQPLPNYAPPTVSVQTPSGATRVVSTGQLPAPTGGAYMYEGAGGTYIPTKITAPPVSGIKVSPISTVISSTGVKRTASTGQIATRAPAIYETNPTPVAPAPKSPTVNAATGFVTKPPASGEKATLIPKSGPVAK